MAAKPLILAHVVSDNFKLIKTKEKLYDVNRRMLEENMDEACASEMIAEGAAIECTVGSIGSVGASCDKILESNVASGMSGEMCAGVSAATGSRRKDAAKTEAKCFLSSTLHAALTMLGEAAIVGDKLKCLPAYNDIENDLLGLIKPLFPNQSIKVYKFGSRICGVGSRDSDLDLFVDIGDTFKIYENRASKETLAKMQVVQKALKNHPKTWKCLVAVDKARVPILKIIHAPTSIECDINFSNSLGYVNTLLLEYIFSLQPVARLMCIYIKKWKHHIGFDKEISTYSMNLMVIFYLQTLDILPPFEKLFRNVDVENSLQVGPWLGSYQQLTLNDLNIKLVDFNKARTYVEEFFVYFSAFEYENMVVCPYFGVGIKKEKFDMLMPNRYTSYIKDNPDFGVEFKKPMIVQDPFQLNRNVTNGVTEFHLKVIKEFMAKSADIIAQTRN
uniref:Poly(A) RNA polymerase mitochondrial-like central palm domain-containing protein n=1 Tax=Stomoxys calcitrans TaxID=35570 RepID=A0A1I8Q2T5_STOCA